MFADLVLARLVVVLRCLNESRPHSQLITVNALAEPRPAGCVVPPRATFGNFIQENTGVTPVAASKRRYLA